MSNESVYAIIKEEPAVPVKGALYQSIRRGKDIPPTYSTFGNHGTSVVLGNVGGYADTDVPCVHPAKKPTGSFGKIVGDTIDPAAFLRMSGNRGVQPGSNKGASPFKRHEVLPKRAPVPKKEEKPIMGLRTEKNYVVANAVENMMSVPKQQPPPPSRAIDNETFGKVPNYVTKRKEEIENHSNMLHEHALRAAKEAEYFYKMTKEEIQELRDQLQSRWDQLNREFATMGFQVETRSQKKHQEQLEYELRTIETALSKIKRDEIYIFDEKKFKYE